jgi:hypothetical protein
MLEATDTIDTHMRTVLDIKRKLVKDTVGLADIEEQGSTLSAVLQGMRDGVGKSSVRPDITRRVRVLHRDVRALCFNRGQWTDADVAQWLTVNEFERGRWERKRPDVLIVRFAKKGRESSQRRTTTIKLADGVTAVIAAS